jgi:pimeloyl-ACP methyl ester carboxylesterase
MQEAFLAATLESKHFVLVHGGGLGAWCWYKSIALLEESGFVATAVDLAGSGIEPTEPNQIKSLAQYVKPLVELLENLSGTEKVFLSYVFVFGLLHFQSSPVFCMNGQVDLVYCC